MDATMKTPEDYLKAAYSRVIIPDEETGTYTAQIAEFPGCIAEADTLDEAYKNLEETAKGWIRAALEMGQTIPQPSCENKYSGKFALRISRTLHRQAAQIADREGVSLNQFIATTIAEKVGGSQMYVFYAEQLTHRLVAAAGSDFQCLTYLKSSAETPVGNVLLSSVDSASTAKFDFLPNQIQELVIWERHNNG
jgi:predicted RNase H-like HicB family nuclease